jgi:hypothetical protein
MAMKVPTIGKWFRRRWRWAAFMGFYQGAILGKYE